MADLNAKKRYFTKNPISGILLLTLFIFLLALVSCNSYANTTIALTSTFTPVAYGYCNAYTKPDPNKNTYSYPNTHTDWWRRKYNFFLCFMGI